MDWRAFTNEVEELFTLQGLERRPDADVVAGTTVARISSDAIDGATRRAQLSSTLTGGGSSASPLALAVKGRKTDRLTPAQAKQLEEVKAARLLLWAALALTHATPCCALPSGAVRHPRAPRCRSH